MRWGLLVKAVPRLSEEKGKRDSWLPMAAAMAGGDTGSTSNSQLRSIECLEHLWSALDETNDEPLIRIAEGLCILSNAGLTDRRALYTSYNGYIPHVHAKKVVQARAWNLKVLQAKVIGERR